MVLKLSIHALVHLKEYLSAYNSSSTKSQWISSLRLLMRMLAMISFFQEDVSQGITVKAGIGIEKKPVNSDVELLEVFKHAPDNIPNIMNSLALISQL